VVAAVSVAGTAARSVQQPERAMKAGRDEDQRLEFDMALPVVYIMSLGALKRPSIIRPIGRLLS
jgi:hypothetical protein